VSGAVSSAVGAKATLVDPDAIPRVTSDHIGWLVARPTGTASRATQHGGNQSEMAILLARILRPGDWVATTLRPPTKTEIRNSRRWFDHRLRTPVTHYSKDPGLVVGTILAGSDSSTQVSNLLSQVASAVPGFDIETKTRRRRSTSPPSPFLPIVWIPMNLDGHSDGDGFRTAAPRESGRGLSDAA